MIGSGAGESRQGARWLAELPGRPRPRDPVPTPRRPTVKNRWKLSPPPTES